MPRRWRKLVGCLTLVSGLAAAAPAAAHGFGQRYDLPLPLSFYIWGAGATVALSFVGFALFLRTEHGPLTWHIDWQAKGRLVASLAAAPRTLASGMLLLVIVAGLFGNQDPIRNIAPVMIWIVGWVGLAFLSVLLGDVWRLINPWNAIFALAELCCRRVRADTALGFARRYPESLATWPAFLLLVTFAWMELVWSGRNDPAALAVALASYSALTFVGMALFGRQQWLARGEMFTLAFGTFARFGPLAAIPQRPGVRLRMPAAGLLTEQPATLSMVALVVALLAIVTFDGLLETPGAAGSQRRARGIRFAVSGCLCSCVPVDGGRRRRARRANRRGAPQLRTHPRADRDRLSYRALFLVVLPRRAIRHPAAIGSAGPRLEPHRNRPLSGGYRARHATAAVDRRRGRGSARPCVRDLSRAHHGASPLL
jgi:hypothetical protein